MTEQEIKNKKIVKMSTVYAKAALATFVVFLVSLFEIIVHPTLNDGRNALVAIGNALMFAVTTFGQFLIIAATDIVGGVLGIGVFWVPVTLFFSSMYLFFGRAVPARKAEIIFEKQQLKLEEQKAHDARVAAYNNKVAETRYDSSQVDIIGADGQVVQPKRGDYVIDRCTKCGVKVGEPHASYCSLQNVEKRFSGYGKSREGLPE